jgi:hypothetical protein
MNIAEAKNIPLADYLQSFGITPCKRQGNSLWYYSPFRQETEPSFKINLVRNEWYDFGAGKISCNGRAYTAKKYCIFVA